MKNSADNDPKTGALRPGEGAINLSESRVIGNPNFRDGFARDCLLQRRVGCELPSRCGGIAGEARRQFEHLAGVDHQRVIAVLLREAQRLAAVVAEIAPRPISVTSIPATVFDNPACCRSTPNTTLTSFSCRCSEVPVRRSCALGSRAFVP